MPFSRQPSKAGRRARDGNRPLSLTFWLAENASRKLTAAAFPKVFRRGRPDRCAESTACYGHILAGDEPLFAETEADFVVALAFGIVEIPLAAGLAPQAPDPVILSAVESADATGLLMRLPLGRDELSVLVERHEKVIADLVLAGGVIFFPREQKPDGAEVRREIRLCRHGAIPFRSYS